MSCGCLWLYILLWQPTTKCELLSSPPIFLSRKFYSSSLLPCPHSPHPWRRKRLQRPGSLNEIAHGNSEYCSRNFERVFWDLVWVAISTFSTASEIIYATSEGETIVISPFKFNPSLHRNAISFRSLSLPFRLCFLKSMSRHSRNAFKTIIVSSSIQFSIQSLQLLILSLSKLNSLTNAWISGTI